MVCLLLVILLFGLASYFIGEHVDLYSLKSFRGPGWKVVSFLIGMLLIPLAMASGRSAVSEDSRGAVLFMFMFGVLLLLVPVVVFLIEFVEKERELFSETYPGSRSVRVAARMAGYTPGMNGHDYERVVARELRRCGWKAYVTQGSGDQGVDVIAKKRDVTMAVQCKRSKSNVGNKAVQEVFAGMHYYGAHIGMVITDSGYTKSARTLANSLDGVYIAHHDQIPSFKMEITETEELESAEDHHFEDHLRDYDKITQK